MLVGAGDIINQLTTIDGSSTWEIKDHDGVVVAQIDSDGNLQCDGNIAVDTINEDTTNAGVTIEGVLLKDGSVHGNTTMARAYLSADQLNLVNCITTQVEFNVETYDPGGNFNTSTHKYTVPVKGYYQVSATLEFLDLVADKYYAVYVRKNGSIFARAFVHASSNGSGLVSTTISDIQLFEVGDLIDVAAYQFTWVNTVDIGGGSEKTYFAIALIQAD